MWNEWIINDYAYSVLSFVREWVLSCLLDDRAPQKPNLGGKYVQSFQSIF
jgi:hypothetical protein